MLKGDNFADDCGHPCDVYFGIGFSKLDRDDVLNLYSTATKSLLLKLKVKNLKYLCLLESILFYPPNNKHPPK